MSTCALCTYVLCALSLACSRSTPPEASVQTTAPVAASALRPSRPPAAETGPHCGETPICTSSPQHPHSELTFISFTTGGAHTNTQLPWIVAFHGLGDRPETFRQLFERVPFQAHVYVPQAPLSYGGGFDWFGVRVGDESDTLKVALDARLSQVQSLISLLSKRPINEGSALVTGFSQGGVLALAVAIAPTLHVRGAFPIAGTLPEQLLSEKPRMPVIAFHGELDRVVPFDRTRALFSRWHTAASNGSPSTRLYTYPTLAHSIDAALWQDWAKALQRALPVEPTETAR